MTDKNRHIERLFKQHYRDMLRHAAMLLHDEDEAKDIVHDVFATLIAGSIRVDEATALPFLLSCVRNKCLNEIRNRSVRERVQRFLLPDTEIESKTPEEMETEMTALLNGIADLFPPVCRDIIRLHFSEGLTFREIAVRLDVSETTIYKHLRSALNQLRETLNRIER